eukprot:7603456-Prorocentrum_lima.AAC.1
MHVPASVIPPHLVACMSMPSHQGNVPALTASAGYDGGDYLMGGTQDAMPPGWQHGQGQGPDAQTGPH